MKVVIPGGSGQIGTVLARDFQSKGHDIVVLSRTPQPAPWRVEAWDARTLGPWASELDGADVVINMAGRTVNCRYTPANLKQIMDSRVESTRVVAQAIAGCARPPRVWLQASTATIYAHSFDAANDEHGTIGGSEPGVPAYWKFSVDVAHNWELATTDPPTPQTRKVLLRSAMTMSPDRDGVFDTMLWLVRRGLGGTAGDGRQYISWIHDRDFIRAMHWLIERDDVSGPVNIAAPHPLPNAEFMRELRQAWGARLGLPALKWMLPIGAWIMRTDTELILKSRRVIPGLLLEKGFTFDFPHWRDAACDLVARWRSGAQPA